MTETSGGRLCTVNIVENTFSAIATFVTTALQNKIQLLNALNHNVRKTHPIKCLPPQKKALAKD